jgi:uncharacterized membrane protein YadS
VSVSVFLVLCFVSLFMSFSVGFKLSLLELVNIGLVGVPCVMASVAAGCWFIPKIATKFGLPDKLGRLIAIGTSVCGVTAISALSPVPEQKC